MQCRLRNIFIVIVLAVVCLPPPAAAMIFSLDCTIGFNGRFQLDHWSPLNLVVENRGRALHGTLEVLVTSGSEYLGDVYRTVYATDVDLPDGTVKRYQFIVAIKSFIHDLVIRLRQNDQTLYTQSVNLRPHFTEKRLAVVVNDFVAPDILSVLPDQLQPVNVRPQFLPEAWYGYDSVQLLIMEPGAIRQLTENQFQALQRWLKQGGYLVIGSSLNYSTLSDKRLQGLLPIRAAGYQRMTELKSLANFSRRPLVAAEPFLVLDAKIDGAAILLQENDVPIISRIDFGSGHIVFLSVDVNAPPFSQWEGRPMFWNQILSLGSVAKGPEPAIDEQKILNAMLAGMPFQFPVFKWGLIFIAAYLIILRVLLKKIRIPGRGRHRYSLILLAVVIVFIVVAYRGFYYPNLGRKLAYNTFGRLDVSGPNVPASADIVIGLYALQNSAYGLYLGPDAYPVSHILAERSPTKVPGPYVLQTSDRGQKIAGSLDRWSYGFYRLQLNVEPHLTGNASQDGAYLTLSVENTLPHKLIDCLVYYRRRFILVDDISANGRQVLKLSLAELKATEIFNDQESDNILRRLAARGGSAFQRAALANLTKDLVLEIHKKYRSMADSMILIAWMPVGLIQPEFVPSDTASTGLTLICWQLPVETAL